MAKAIDRLDVDEKVRRKAQAMFKREQIRLDYEARSLAQSPELASTQRSGARSFREG